MKYRNGLMIAGFALCMASSLFGQGTATQQRSQEQIAENAASSVAVVVARRMSTNPIGTKGAGIVVRQNGILLTPYTLIKDAQYVQVRFKSGEIFDQIQLLGVDQRRHVAAIKITAAALPVPPIATIGTARFEFWPCSCYKRWSRLLARDRRLLAGEVAEFNRQAIAPPGQEGWLRHKEKIAIATSAPQTGWWINHKQRILFSNLTYHPASHAEVASRNLLMAQHPSWPGGAIACLLRSRPTKKAGDKVLAGPFHFFPYKL